MRTVVLRPGRYRAAWQDETDPQKTIETEFWDKESNTPDLSPSVYVFNVADEDDVRGHIVQALAQHYASDLASPPNVIFALDLQGFGPQPIQEDREKAKFSFCRKAHHYLEFSTAADLGKLVEEIRARLADRMIEVSREEFWRYVEARLEERDPEWLAACSKGQPAEKWPEEAERRRATHERKKVKAEQQRAEQQRVAERRKAGDQRWKERRALREAGKPTTPPSQLKSDSQPPATDQGDEGKPQSSSPDLKTE